MADILDELFTTDVLSRLASQKTPSKALTLRIAILTAVEEADADLSERCWQRVLRARRAAWVAYVTSMRAVGLLDADVVARLTGIDDDGFRSAVSECLTCHFLGHILGLEVFGRHEGRPGKVIDLGVRHADGDLSVEVKSPFAEKPVASVWISDHVHIIQPAIDEANKQFAEGRRNVLVVAPLVEFPVLHGRMPYVKAFFGETKVVFAIDTQTGGAVGEPEWRFITEGKFLKLWPEPRFTRTAAVVALREAVLEENQFDETFAARVELRWFVMHNPYCPVTIPTDIWGDAVQLVRDGDVIRWTDGAPVDGSPPNRS